MPKPRMPKTFLNLAGRRACRSLFALTLVLLTLGSLHPAFADIYQWEWVDPGDYSLGRRESAILAPDGVGQVAEPNASLNSLDLTMAWLHDTDLNNTNFSFSTLVDADLSHSNLSNVTFYNAVMTDARINGADFSSTTDSGFTAVQFYSTNNYLNGYFFGTALGNNDLTGWDFSNKYLQDVNFANAMLDGANFTGAEIYRVNFESTTDSGFSAAQLYSTNSYLNRNLFGIALGNNDLTGWDFSYQALQQANLSNSKLSNTNLQYADLISANLLGADLGNAEIRGAKFNSTTDSGFTSTQLYSTASYQAKDLSNVDFGFNDLTGWNFNGQLLNNVSFSNSILLNVDLRDAEVRRANFYSTVDSGFTSTQLYSTASYRTKNLSGINLSTNNLTSWNFAGQNLTDAVFSFARLTNVNFTDAEIRNANFRSTTGSGFTSTQFYSTASYQTGNLSGINFRSTGLGGWDLSGKNLTNTNFQSAALYNTNFSNADIRGASSFSTSGYFGVNTDNLIHPDGHVEGLNIYAAETMRLWDYDPETPLPIYVTDTLNIDPTATLKIVLEDDHWGSTLIFESGINVNLDGTLELLVDPDETANITSLVGTTFGLFDWTGVTPTGTFAQIVTGEGLVWDTSSLYTSGDVTLLEVPGYLFGDFNNDGFANGADFLTLQANLGTTSGATGAQGDADGDGDVDNLDQRIFEARFGTDIVAAPGDLDGDGNYDGTDFLKWQRGFSNIYNTADYDAWQANLGIATPAISAATTAVPEPTSFLLMLLGLALCGRCPNRQRS